MKKILVLIPALLFITACTIKTPSAENTATGVEYPRTQSGTPATVFCEDNGGTVSIEQQGTLDIAYCMTKDGQKVDAWKYMSDMTSMTGETSTGAVK